MIYIRNIVSKFFKKEIIQLGRWSINYNENQLNHKIYLANHDHCGPCGSISQLSKNKEVMEIESIVNKSTIRNT